MVTLRYLHKARTVAIEDPTAMDEAAAIGNLPMVRFLHQHVAAPCSKAAMDRAARSGHLDVVRFLHEHRSEGCTTAALDGAAGENHLDVVQFLHAHRSEGATTDAMDAAAGSGLMDVVAFLHRHRSEGCTPRAMDDAAGNGHLTVVAFLHANRTEGCTTAAMDTAARAGRLDIVEFLHRHRREGCTATALEDAASYGHFEVLAFLMMQYPQLCTTAIVTNAAAFLASPQGAFTDTVDRLHSRIVDRIHQQRPDLFDDVAMMPALLLAGAFDVWRVLRRRHKCDDDTDGAVDAMQLGARTFRLATIRFLIDECGRRELVPLALHAAALEAPTWLYAIVAVSQGQSRSEIDVSAAMREIMDNWHDGLAPNLAFLASIGTNECLDRTIQYAKGLAGHRDDLVQRIMQLRSTKATRGAVSNDLARPLVLLHDAPVWVPTVEFARGAYQRPHVPGALGQSQLLTWPIYAMHHNDAEFLTLLLRLGDDDPYRGDPKFSLAGARRAAVYYDRLELLSLLGTREPIEPTLLDDAIFYRKLDVAKWLVGHCPEGCRRYGTHDPSQWSMEPTGLTQATLDWLLDDGRCAELVDFGEIAMYAAAEGELSWLEALMARFPEAVRSNTRLLDHAVSSGSLPVVEFLWRIGYRHASADILNAAARNLEIFRFLVETTEPSRPSSLAVDLAALQLDAADETVVFYLIRHRHRRASFRGALLATADRLGWRHRRLLMFLRLRPTVVEMAMS